MLILTFSKEDVRESFAKIIIFTIDRNLAKPKTSPNRRAKRGFIKAILIRRDFSLDLFDRGQCLNLIKGRTAALVFLSPLLKRSSYCTRQVCMIDAVIVQLNAPLRIPFDHLL